MGDARRERERESRICLFEESEPRRTVAKGCIIKSIHSGLPNRSILIREPFQGRRCEKRTRLFVHLLARDGASFFPLPPLVDTEKMHDNFLADSASLCGVEEKDTAAPNTTGKEEWNRQPNRAPLIELIPSFNCLDLGKTEVVEGGQKFVDRIVN